MVVMTTCEPGCTCKRHSRKPLSEESRRNIAEANRARTNNGRKCPPGCTCSRHKAYYRGGSTKGRKLSEQAKKNLSEGAKERAARPEEKQRFADMAAVNRQDPEKEARRIEALREALEGTSCPEDCACGKHSEEARRKISEAHAGKELTDEHKGKIGDASRATWASLTPEQRKARIAKQAAGIRAAWAVEKAENRVRQTGGYLHSKHELSLVPYLEAMGYIHNPGKYWIGRRVPDFIDFEGKRIFEYFGAYWHPRREEEAEIVDYYRLKGWVCTVLWEDDLFAWLDGHKDLVTEEQHDAAWKTAHINNGYKKPGLV
jgi:hypothetical protein